MRMCSYVSTLCTHTWFTHTVQHTQTHIHTHDITTYIYTIYFFHFRSSSDTRVVFIHTQFTHTRYTHIVIRYIHYIIATLFAYSTYTLRTHTTYTHTMYTLYTLYALVHTLHALGVCYIYTLVTDDTVSIRKYVRACMHTTYVQTHIYTVISRNQACTGLCLACIWYKKVAMNNQNNHGCENSCKCSCDLEWRASKSTISLTFWQKLISELLVTANFRTLVV